MQENQKSIAVIGAGLAGCEAAWQAANRGAAVTLYEMKPQQYSPAHHYPGFAELVCSNSLKAARIGSAAGLLKEEMRRLGSLSMYSAAGSAVAAGGALAVDREQFSDTVTERIKSHPNITVVPKEITAIPENGIVVIATGPLTSDGLAQSIREYLGSETLSFYDAAAPIVSYDSLDLDKVFFAARYGRGEDDYINCPMNREEYERFYEELIHAQSAPLHEFDAGMPVYEGCMPVEVMAKRGPDTLRFGPLKPVGLTDPRTGKRPWAVVQLRRENTAGSLYNLVGFQTNLKFPEQKRVFSLIPGLENAAFMRYGVMHRNTFLDSPRLLSSAGNLRKEPRLFFAGQMTGVEGYMESAASGILCGMNSVRFLEGKPLAVLPRDTMLGALMAYISDEQVENFQPMGANMGILPPSPQRIRDKTKRYELVALRALESLRQTIERERLLEGLAPGIASQTITADFIGESGKEGTLQ